MKITAGTARLATLIALAYMVMLGAATVMAVGPSQTVAIHYGPTLEPNYGLPALLAVAILPLMALIIVSWLVRPGRDGLVEGERLSTLALTLAITGAVQTFICLMAIF